MPPSAVGPGGASADAAAGDAAASLTTALAPLLKAATFITTVSVDGTVAATSTGRSVGTTVSLRVTSGGKSVDYIEVPPKAWARQGGGSWVLIAFTKAPGSPIAILAAPTSVALADPGSLPSPWPGVSPPASGSASSAAPGAGALVVLQATYPAAALGLQGDPVTVKVTIDGSIVTFQYAADAGGHHTTSVTALTPGAATPAIVAPSP